MKELLSVKSRGLDVPIDIIQNSAELNDVGVPENRSNNKLIKELQVEDELIILHAGNIGYPTDVDTIIGVMKRLNRDSRFHFVFIGSGVKRKHLVKAIKDFELSNLTLLDQRPEKNRSIF